MHGAGPWQNASPSSSARRDLTSVSLRSLGQAQEASSARRPRQQCRPSRSCQTPCPQDPAERPLVLRRGLSQCDCCRCRGVETVFLRDVPACVHIFGCTMCGVRGESPAAHRSRERHLDARRGSGDSAKKRGKLFRQHEHCAMAPCGASPWPILGRAGSTHVDWHVLCHAVSQARQQPDATNPRATRRAAHGVHLASRPWQAMHIPGVTFRSCWRRACVGEQASSRC